MSDHTNLDPMDLLNSSGLGPQSLHVASLALQDDDLGQMMREALSTPGDQLKARQQILLTIIVDDSYSIRENGLEQILRECVNAYVEAQKGGHNAGGILVSVIYLNGKVLMPYRPISEFIPLDASNYKATGRTPLYDVTGATLPTVVAEANKVELETGVRRVVTWTLIVSDGQDWKSEVLTAQHVAQIAEEMYSDEGKHIIGAIGLGTHWPWKKVFTEMGLREQWIMNAGDNPQEMRAAFDNMSRSTKQTINQVANGSFTQQAMAGGFGAP